ncbi:MAG: glycosyltransferase [Calditrichaeota bacterium]|nr:glycosyltransferase [Calditrichota bacterium]
MSETIEHFQRNADYDIYFPKNFDKQPFNYSDGQDAENYVYSVIKNARDRRSFSIELASKIRDWPSLYHLSPLRANLFRALYFDQPRDMKVLELGAGCGAITRYLGEHFGEVHAIEGSTKRAIIARERCSGLDNVRIFNANFLQVDVTSRYDLTTLIGVLEYSPIYHPNASYSREEKVIDVLKRAFHTLAENGQLVVAIENKLGLKYWAGSHEDHTNALFEGIMGYPHKNRPITFSRKELENMLHSAGFRDVQILSVFPDYKLPTTFLNVTSDEGEDLNLYHWIETPFPDRAGQSGNLFSEALALRELDRAGLLAEFANSFLIIASKNPPKEKPSWLAKRISSNRHPAFAAETTLNRDSLKKIQKKKLFPDTALPNEFIKQTISNERYIKGELWVYELYEALARKTFEQDLIKNLKKLNALALARFSKQKEDSEGFQLLDGKAFDFAFWNIIHKNDDYMFFDREWDYLKPFSIDYLLFRNLTHFIIRQNGNLPFLGNIDYFTLKMIQTIYPHFHSDRLMKLKRQEDDVTQIISFGEINRPEIDLSSRRQAARARASIIIPVLNQVKYTRQCLDALFDVTPEESFEVIVVDNGSTDGTQAYLESIREKIKVIRNEENLGFAKACNQGARAASGDVLVFLNNDTVPQKGWLESLVETLNRENVGIVGSKLIFPDGSTQHAGVVFTTNQLPYHIYEGLPENLDFINQEETYSAVTGACLALSKELFFQVGLFDESYLNGLEDIDLCLKVKKLGKKIIYQPKSQLIHFTSKTEGRQDYMEKNKEIFLKKWISFIKRDDFHYYLKNNYVPYFHKESHKISWIYSSHPLFSIVIVTYHSERTLGTTLKSIYENTTIPYEIIIVDNASKKDVQDVIEELDIQLPVSVIRNSENLGFSKACNQGIRQAKGDYIVLLNPDTAVTSDWLSRMLRHFSPDTGAVGPISNYAAGLQNYIHYVDPKWQGDFPLEKLAELIARQNVRKSVETKLLIGFCMMIRREAIEKVGLLDEELFLGNDDLDYSLRLREAGYTLKIATDTFVYHEGQHSFKTLESAEKERLMQESLDRFYAKLERTYGEGKVPSSTELWGIDILGVPTKFKQMPPMPPLLTAQKPTAWLKNKRVALIYDNQIRPDTTGEYGKRALASLCRVTHFLPEEMDKIKPGDFDLYLFVDDGLRYPIPFQLRPNAWWVIDTHLQYDYDREKAKLFDYVFAAQKDGAQRLLQDGIRNVFWLPLAADPQIHKKLPARKEYTVSFVGHFAEGPRNHLLKVIQANFNSVFIGQKFFKEMAQIYSKSKIVFNRSLKNDINMRVFEAMATGSLLVTNDLSDNGLTELATPDEHLVTYTDEKELLEKLHYYLEHPAEREKIARNGRNWALRKHTYRHRMAALLETVFTQEKQRQPEEVKSLTSIVLLTYNGLEYTQKCIESIRKHTHVPYELIVVDNGSTDGMVNYLKSQKDVHLIQNKKNRGFAAGNNQGIRASKGDFIVLLNNDTVVTDGWLRRLLRGFHLSPKVGMVGPKSNYVQNPLQVVNDVGYENLEEMQVFAQKFARKNKNAYWTTTKLVGFCLALKREVVDRVGLLDESFGLGNFEDDDYCVRARKAGYYLIIAGDVFIHHYGNRAFQENKISYEKMMRENLRRFQEKWKHDVEFRGERYYLKEDIHGFALSEIAAGERAFARGEIESARKHFLKALEWEPENAQALNDLGVVTWKLNRPDEALDCFVRAVSASPENSDAKENLLQLVQNTEISGKLKQTLNRLIQSLKDVPFLYKLGTLLLEKNRVSESEACFGRIPELDQSAILGEIGFALIDWEQGRLEEAMQKMDNASRRDPQNRDLILQYALMAFQIGQGEEAVQLLKEYLRAHSDPEIQQTLQFLEENTGGEKVRQPEVEEVF